METIEDYFKQNKDLFDTDEPEDGHIERFQRKITKLGIRKLYSGLVYAFAASIAALMILSFATYQIIKTHSSSKGGEFSELSGDYKEIENFYSGKINCEYSELIAMTHNAVDKNTIVKEFSDMDANYQALKLDLKSNPNDDRLINAMIEYYRTRLDFIITIKQKMHVSYNSLYHENNKM
jgi:hypothetical protein